MRKIEGWSVIIRGKTPSAPLAILLFLTFFSLALGELSPAFGQNGGILGRSRRLEKARTAQPAASARTTGASPRSAGSGQHPAAAESLSKASTSPQSAREAVERIPWNALLPEDRSRVESLVRDHSLYRRLPMAGGRCNPEIFDYFLCHPEMVIGLWRALGYSEVGLNAVGPGVYRLRESSGTSAEIRIFYHDNHQMLVWCRGVYRSAALARPLTGEAFGLLQYRFTEEAREANAPITISRFDCFIRIESAGIEMLGRMFAPLVGKIVDSNYAKTVDFVNGVSESAEINSAGLIETVQKIDGVDRRTLDDLLAVVVRTENQAYQRQRGEKVDYILLPKKNQPESAMARLLSRPAEPSPQYVAAIPAQKIGESAPSAPLPPVREESVPEIFMPEEVLPENVETEIVLPEAVSQEKTLLLEIPMTQEAAPKISKAPKMSEKPKSPETVGANGESNGESEGEIMELPEMIVYQVEQGEKPAESKKTMIFLDSEQKSEQEKEQKSEKTPDASSQTSSKASSKTSSEPSSKPTSLWKKPTL